ncbi:MAG: aldo/keto reductase [Vicinamibacteria bacterium]|jgi:predicted aldo/keto reductase-like oxidoreductase|nr:aldo/keto reductase [Vicinamibacteria bacterium]
MSVDKPSWSRRDFMIRPAIGVAAAAISARAADAGDKKKKPAEPVGPIVRSLGKTGLKVPIVSMGVMNADAPNLVRHAFELGVRYFDTAAIYQNGRNEEMLGAVVRELKCREQVVIATKTLVRPLRKQLTAENAASEGLRLTDESLKRLQMDSVDVLFVHDISTAEEMNQPELLVAIDAVRQAKKARFLGVSTHRGQAAVLREAARSGQFEVVLVSVNAAMSDNADLIAAIDEAAAKGIGIVAMKTQAGGRWPARGSAPDLAAKPIHHTALLKWVLRHQNIATSIPGMTTIEQIEMNWPVASDLALNAEEKAFLGDARLKAALSFCEQCEGCLPSCPRGAAVPTLMRAHMYAWQYGNVEHAVATLGDLDRGRGLAACSLCEVCTARCVRAVDVPGRVADLRRLAQIA